MINSYIKLYEQSLLLVDYVMLKNRNLCRAYLNEIEFVIKCWKQTVLVHVIRDYYQIVDKIVFIYNLVSYSRHNYIIWNIRTVSWTIVIVEIRISNWLRLKINDYFVKDNTYNKTKRKEYIHKVTSLWMGRGRSSADFIRVDIYFILEICFYLWRLHSGVS